MKKFRVDLFQSTINEHEIVRETEKRIVFIDRFRDYDSREFIQKEFTENKVSRHHFWEDTFQEAKQKLIALSESSIKHLESRIKYEKERLLKIKNL